MVNENRRKAAQREVERQLAPLMRSLENQIKKNHPAAPFEGLDILERVSKYPHGTYFGKNVSEGTEVVDRSQAEAVIAAKDADIDQAIIEKWDLEEIVEKLKTDNAALTARVKELEGEVFHTPELGITWKQMCEQYDKECTHHQQRSEALETQLAAAKEREEHLVSLLKAFTSQEDREDPELRAALEAKP